MYGNKMQKFTKLEYNMVFGDEFKEEFLYFRGYEQVWFRLASKSHLLVKHSKGFEI